MAAVTADGGWSWLVCIGTFIATFLEIGMVKALGVLLPILREQCATQTWIIGFIISFVPGFGAVTCPMAGALSKRFSARYVVMIFNTLSALGLMFGSVAVSIPMLSLSFILTAFVALILNPMFSAMNSYIGLVMLSIAFGCGRGAAILAFYQNCKESLGENEMTHAVMCTHVSYSIGALISGFISGWIFDETGSYTMSFYILGGIALASVCPKIKSQQQKITMILDSKKIPYEILDISSSVSDKQKMRDIAGDSRALPPQITNDDQYCGDFNAFDNALEAEALEEFLQLK